MQRNDIEPVAVSDATFAETVLEAPRPVLLDVDADPQLVLH